MANTVLVTGAGGFIGHHLTNFLKEKGYWVRAVDIKYPEFSASNADEFILTDLREYDHCIRATKGIETVYNLAADMGGRSLLRCSSSLNEDQARSSCH